MTGIVTAGNSAFSNLTEHEDYQGQSTGRFSLVITLDEQEAKKLENMGVKIKTYTNPETGVTALQRKFATKYHVDVVDIDGSPVSGEIPYGSKVRLLWKASEDAHPQHGVGTYLNKVRVVEFAEGSDEDTPEEF